MAKPRGLREVEIADAVFGALAHPMRRQILLSVHYRGSCNAGDIAHRFDKGRDFTQDETGAIHLTQIGHELLLS